MDAPHAKTILAVDDEPAVLRLVSLILKTNGHQVLEAASGPRALEVIGEFPGRIDLLVTDVNMAPMSGLELAAAVRERQSSLPVLYITGFAPAVELVSEEVQTGMAGLLMKPFAPMHIADAVNRLLSGLRQDHGPGPDGA